MMKRFTALLCAVSACMMLAACTVESILPENTAKPDYPHAVTDPRPVCEPEARVYFDGLLTASGRIKDGKIFIPVSAFFSQLGLEAAAEYQRGTLSVSVSGISITAREADAYICADGRYYYNPDGFIFDNGEVYFTPEIIDWLFSCRTAASDNRADVDTTSLRLISGGSSYYQSRYDFEDIYWLSHIIYAEAMNQPLEGLIGVGNVVLNRIRHPLFPSTVYEVVYDNKYRVQFEATLNGALGDEIDEISLLAAYMCLEGCNTVGESIYFINPEKGSDDWLRTQKQFVVTYGKHDFYSEKES